MIKAAPLRGAAGRVPASRLRPWEAPAGRAPGPTPGLPQDQSGRSGTQPDATGPAVHSGWTSVAMPAARRAAAVTGLSLAAHATSQ
jgi:hypothetical protein